MRSHIADAAIGSVSADVGDELVMIVSRSFGPPRVPSADRVSTRISVRAAHLPAEMISTIAHTVRFRPRSIICRLSMTSQYAKRLTSPLIHTPVTTAR